jgi:hypothetical protein
MGGSFPLNLISLYNALLAGDCQGKENEMSTTSRNVPNLRSVEMSPFVMPPFGFCGLVYWLAP